MPIIGHDADGKPIHVDADTAGTGAYDQEIARHDPDWFRRHGLPVPDSKDQPDQSQPGHDQQEQSSKTDK